MATTRTPHDQLIQAVRQDDPIAIQAALKAGAALDRPELVGLMETETPLEMALSMGHAKALACLDQAGAAWPDRVGQLLRHGPLMGVTHAKTLEAQTLAKTRLDQVLEDVEKRQPQWRSEVDAIREESNQAPAPPVKPSLMQRLRRRP